MSTATETVKDVVVPDIGDFADVPVIEILVSPGDTVAAEDALVTLESDKATMDVPSPFAGTVKDIKVSPGDRVSEGALLLTLAVLEEGDPPAAEGAEKPASGADKPASTAGSADADDPSAAAAERAPSSSAASAGPASASAGAADNGATPYASPSVRALARQLGVDLATVKGSGRKGRITKEDVQKAKDAPAAGPGGGVAIAGLNMAPWPKVDFEKYGPIERVPLSRIQKISGPNLARNWVMIPHVTHHDEADITDLEAFRKKVNSEQDVKVTMVALLVKAVVASLKAFPDFNASLDGDDLVYKRYFHIGFAADTPGGLVVPVIRDADSKGLLEIASDLIDLSGRARAGKLKGEEMRGGTFTISSLGGIGGTAFTPIVNAPEVAILGVTRSAMKPVWDGSAFQPRLMCGLSLSYDHRVIDGAKAARFVVHLGGVLSDFRRVLL